MITRDRPGPRILIASEEPTARISHGFMRPHFWQRYSSYPSYICHHDPSSSVFDW
jgi:hypothetical protein